MEELIERIDKLRVEHNYSIYELAVRSGLSVNTIKYLYKKKSFPNIRTIYSICEAFEIPIWLLFYKSESNSFITKSEYTLINNFSNLSVTGKRLLLELSENLKYLALTLEQYNNIAGFFMTLGDSIAENTDLISKLPTQEGLEKILTNEVRSRMFRIENIVKNGQEMMTASVEKGLSKQTEVLKELLHKEINRMMSELKANWKLKLKWILIGAILPSMLLILQLILR